MALGRAYLPRADPVLSFDGVEVLLINCVRRLLVEGSQQASVKENN